MFVHGRTRGQLRAHHTSERTNTWESSPSSSSACWPGPSPKALLPGKDPGGIIVTALIGIAGALIGGFVAGALFDADPLDEFFDISTWLTAIVGAIALLWAYRLVTNRHGHEVGA